MEAESKVVVEEPKEITKAIKTLKEKKPRKTKAKVLEVPEPKVFEVLEIEVSQPGPSLITEQRILELIKQEKKSRKDKKLDLIKAKKQSIEDAKALLGITEEPVAKKTRAPRKPKAKKLLIVQEEIGSKEIPGPKNPTELKQFLNPIPEDRVPVDKVSFSDW